MQQLKKISFKSLKNKQKDFLERRLASVQSSLSSTVSAAAEQHFISPHIINYWRYKKKNHPGTWGGNRNSHLSPNERMAVASLIKVIIQYHPTFTVNQLRLKLETTGFHLTESYIRYVIKDMGWSFKKPEYKQILKFEEENLKKYTSHLCWVNINDWNKIVFMDEVHFNSKDLRKRRVLGPTSERIHIQTDTSLSFSFSLTVAVRYDGTIFCSPQRNTNDQFNFLDFVEAMVESGFLTSGDTLVMDNATVHTGNETHSTAVQTLNSSGIGIRFLPAYSPELNPIELVFGFIKNFVREHRTLTESDLPVLVSVAMSKVSTETIQLFYKKSCRPWYKEEE